MDYIYYHDNSSLTGKELKRALNISGGTGGPEQRPQRLIRWGNRGDVRFNAAGGCLNRKSALNDASNKARALELMNAAGIQVPPAADRFNGEMLIGRTETHMQGSGLFLITSQRDYDLAIRNLHCTHFMTYVPTEREYRVHVFKGNIVGVGEKRMTDNATSLHIRNVGTGWTFHYIDNAPADIRRIGQEAVQALGLDFGAVDVIKSVNRNLYVLEVNTAPSLVKPVEGGARNEVERGPMFDSYVAAFRDWLDNN